MLAAMAISPIEVLPPAATPPSGIIHGSHGHGDAIHQRRGQARGPVSDKLFTRANEIACARRRFLFLPIDSSLFRRVGSDLLTCGNSG